MTLTGKRRVLANFPEPVSGGVQDVSRDGHGLLLLGEFTSSIVVLPPGETKERELSWLGHSGVAAVSRDGKRLLFNDGARSVGRGVYLRSADELLPPILLAGRSRRAGLSPDSKWAIVVRDAPPSELELIPTGPGEKRMLKVAGIDTADIGATFFPDGKRILIDGEQPGLRSPDAGSRISTEARRERSHPRGRLFGRIARWRAGRRPGCREQSLPVSGGGRGAEVSPGSGRDGRTESVER